MRVSIKTAAIVALGFLLMPLLAYGEEPSRKPFAVRHSSTEDTAIIQVSGLENALVVLHITDAHVSIADKREDQYEQYASRMDYAYGKEREHWRTKKKATTATHFLDLLASAKDRNADLIALTGDIVNNPSQSSVQFVRNALKDTGIRWLFISGNHDWHYEGMAGSDDALRKTWVQKSLLPLYPGRNPLCYAVRIGGINFVALDNSTYQVTGEQLAFYEKEIVRGLPTVLLLHIPIYTPANAGKHASDSCGDPSWGWETDRSYAIERRERWSKRGNLKSTTDFVDRVGKAGNLIAVLAGHTHKARADKLSDSATQYVAQAACNGGSRLITFAPCTDNKN
ncbi:MAG: metallophosphoesterase [Verrucomicrobia bacterium]|nr:metallophosphoesterase [Verrucomicrobiota bacterium]